MATVEECRAVISSLADQLSAVDADARKKHVPDRTIELALIDIDMTFRGRLHEGDLIDIEENANGPKPNIRLVMTSDDLIDLTEGKIKFAHAWATGKIRLDASIRDLLRLRSLL